RSTRAATLGSHPDRAEEERERGSVDQDLWRRWRGCRPEPGTPFEAEPSPRVNGRAPTYFSAARVRGATLAHAPDRGSVRGAQDADRPLAAAYHEVGLRAPWSARAGFARARFARARFARARFARAAGARERCRRGRHGRAWAQRRGAAARYRSARARAGRVLAGFRRRARAA